MSILARLGRLAAPPSDPGALALFGERAARRYLERRGYLCLAARYRTRHGELDLVMQDGEAIVFVEVKTRRSLRAGTPAEAVTAAKARHMEAVAAAWLKAHRSTHRSYRFDVVAVTYEGRRARIEHLKGAGR